MYLTLTDIYPIGTPDSKNKKITFTSDVSDVSNSENSGFVIEGVAEKFYMMELDNKYLIPGIYYQQHTTDNYFSGHKCLAYRFDKVIFHHDYLPKLNDKIEVDELSVNEPLPKLPKFYYISNIDLVSPSHKYFQSNLKEYSWTKWITYFLWKWFIQDVGASSILIGQIYLR